MRNRNKFFVITILAIVTLMCVFAIVACDLLPNGGETHECKHKCAICGKCTDETCQNEVCKDKCQGHEAEELLEYDMSGIELTDNTVTYDGSAQTLEIAGTLPQGVTVSYEYYSGEDKLDSAPVNAGEYRVVAKFTGDAQHKEIADMTANLTIEKADIRVVLGATKNADDEPLSKTITFAVNADGDLCAYVADDSTYTIEVLSSNAEVEFDFYGRLNDDKTVDESSLINGKLSKIGDVRYVLVNLANADDAANYNDNLVLTVKGLQRIVEIRTYDDLLLMASDIETYSVGVRRNAVYKLMNDVDCGGNVWKTIGTRVPTGSDELDPYKESFLSEFDGQGYKVYNYKITEESVAVDNINDKNGIALGFFGFVSDADIHDVTFADITVDFDISKLADEDKYGENAYVYNGENYVYFGVIAGRVNIDDVYRTGAHFSNINVENLDATKFTVVRAYVGTFFGWDSGLSNTHNVTNDTPTRENLNAENIDFLLKQRLSMILPSHTGIYLGGFVGAMFTYMPLVYDNCSVSDISMVLERDMTDVEDSADAYFYGTMSGFAAWHMQAISGTFVDGFENCTLKNYFIENKSSDVSNRNGMACGTEYGSNRTYVTLTDCTIENDDDTDSEYGFFRYKYTYATQKTEKWAYDVDAKQWLHVCLSVCPVCGKCTNEDCQEPACQDKCLKHGEDHVCLSECPICHKCANEDCDEDNCKDKCQGHTADELLVYDMSGVEFTDNTVTYNGEGQSLEITGTLPQGVTVRYEYYSGETKLDSKPVNAGTYTVIAKFVGDEWHKPIADMEATLTVDKAAIDMSGARFDDVTVTYDGKEHTIVVTGLPSMITVEYEYYYDGVKLDKDVYPVNAGVYKVVAKFTGGGTNYEAKDNLEAVLTVEKADFEVYLGSKGNLDNTTFGQTVKFMKEDNSNVYTAYFASGAYGSYLIEYLGNALNLDVTCTFYTQLNGETVSETNGGNRLSKANKTRYALITLNDAQDKLNYNDNVILTIVGTEDNRVVEIDSYEDLLIMASDIYDLPLEVRQNAIYKIIADIDCEGRVWQTIGALSVPSSDKDKYAFASELDGNGKTISNFQITNDSVRTEDIPDVADTSKHHALAFGFFGYVSVGKVHNVTFDSITVDIVQQKMGSSAPSSWTGNSYFDFGVVAGYVGSSWVNDFHDITVSNLTARIMIAGGRIGTFFGYDEGRDPNLFKNHNVTTERKNLNASNIKITAYKDFFVAGGTEPGITLGGIVGTVSGAGPIYYVGCTLTDITLAVSAYPNWDGADRVYTTYLGGFVGYHDTVAWENWSKDVTVGDVTYEAMAPELLHDKFENCTIENYLLINKSRNTNVNNTDLYIGYEAAPSNSAKYRQEVQFVNCTTTPEAAEGTKYGVFRYDTGSVLYVAVGSNKDGNKQWVQYNSDAQ